MGVLNLSTIPSPSQPRENPLLTLLGHVGGLYAAQKIKDASEKTQADEAQTALEEMYNPPRDVVTATSSDVENAAAQKKMAEQEPNPLEDLVKPIQSKPDETLPNLLNGETMPPLQTKATDVFPEQTERQKPVVGDQDYRQPVPKGLPADVYGRMASSEVAKPSMSRLLAERVKNGEMTMEEAFKMQRPEGIQMVKNAQGNYEGIARKAGNSGVQAYTPEKKYTTKNEYVKEDDGTERLHTVWYDPTDPNKPPIVGGKVNDPMQTGIARAEAMRNTGPVDVLDVYDGNRPVKMSWGDANKTNKDLRAQGQPDRYAPTASTIPALEKAGMLNNMHRTIRNVRTDLSNPNFPPFDSVTAGQYAEMLRTGKPSEVVQEWLKFQIGRTLTPEQADYMIDVAFLREDALSLRSVMKAGPGSDQLRDAILQAMINPSTPNKDYAAKILDKYAENLVGFGQSVPNVTLGQPQSNFGNMPVVKGGELLPRTPTKPGSLPAPPARPAAAPAASRYGKYGIQE